MLVGFSGIVVMCMVCFAVDLGSIRFGVICYNVFCMLFYFISFIVGYLVNLKFWLGVDYRVSNLN